MRWSGPAGYVQLSPAYERDATAAKRLGWPVRRCNSHHLAPASDPEAVAEVLLWMLAELPRTVTP